MTLENLWMLAMLALFGLFLWGMHHEAKRALNVTRDEKLRRLEAALQESNRTRDFWCNLWFAQLRAEEAKAAMPPEVQYEGRTFTERDLLNAMKPGKPIEQVIEEFPLDNAKGLLDL